MHACFIVEIDPAARKMQPFTRFWRKISALSLQMAIFRRLNAIFITFYMPNLVHVVFSVETSTAARKSQTFTRFWRKQIVISLLLERFRRLKGIFARFYATNVMHASFIVETGPTACKMQPFTRLWRKLSALSLLFKVFRSLNAVIERFYDTSSMQACFNVAIRPTARKMQLFTQFWWKLRALSLLLEIFRRSNCIFIAF